MDKKAVTVLMILDGLGLNDNPVGNAFHKAQTPNIDFLMKTYPFQKGYTSGLDVGLPDGQMGNSEVGHLNIGAGRIVYQELTRISKSIADGDFFENEALVAAVENAKRKGTALHLIGLLSDGGVHSHIEHLFGLLRLAKMHNLEKVYVHCMMDGRDTPPNSGEGYIRQLQEEMERIGIGQIATISGRYYSMDRDNRWERVKKAYNAMVMGEGVLCSDPLEAMVNSYKNGETDEFVLPTVITRFEQPVATVNPEDSIVFFNFRPDRARQITRAFCDQEFEHFKRGKGFMPLVYTCFTNYDITIDNKLVAFEKSSISNTLGEYLADLGKTQLRLAETEKYAHVTFFFNGGVEAPNKNEDRILVPSPKVATYDLKPEMSAYEVGDNLVKAILSNKYDLIIINFANPDMVGHTGVLPAAVKAIEAVDGCVGNAYQALLEVGGQMFLCADHGNSEQLIDYETGEPFTAHTTNPVPFVLINADPKYGLAEHGKLADIAPTLLELMNIPIPKEMTGQSLLIEREGK